MAGSPSQAASERQSRKRRGSHITPDKSKKSTSGQSPSGAEISTNKPANTGPAEAKASSTTTTATTKEAATTDDKADGSVVDGSAKPKGNKSGMMGKPFKIYPGKVLAKEKQLDETEKASVKKEDTKARKPDTKEKSNKEPEIPKVNQGVKLPDLVKPVASDSDGSTDDDSDESGDSDSFDDSDESSDSEDSSDTSDSEKTSDIDHFDEDLYGAFELEYQSLEDLSPECLAVEKANTLRRVQDFVDNTKDKHYHNFKLETLTGPANYISWLVGLEVLLRMHQVWCVVGVLSVPLDKDHEMYPWYEHMVNVAISLIYAHVSQEIRSHRCFMSSVMQRSPDRMMQHIWAHFGRSDADESH